MEYSSQDSKRRAVHAGIIVSVAYKAADLQLSPHSSLLMAYARMKNPRQMGRSNYFVFDMVIDIPSDRPMIALMKYYNGADHSFQNDTIWSVWATVTKTIDGIDAQYSDAVPSEDRLTAMDFDLVGDISTLHPEPESVDLTERYSFFHLAGVAFNTDKKAQFEMAPDQYVSFVAQLGKKTNDQDSASGPKTNSKAKHLPAPLPIIATVQDSGKWKKAKPVPLSNNKYVSLFATLTRVQREGDTASKFRVDVNDITFLGNAPICPVNDAPAPSADNDNIRSPALKKLRVGLQNSTQNVGSIAVGKRSRNDAA